MSTYSFRKSIFSHLITSIHCRFKLLKKDRAFSKFYRRYSGSVEKYNVTLKKLLQQGIAEPEFYGD